MDDVTPQSTPDHADDQHLHNIKTAFTVIIGNLQLIERKLKAGREIPSDQLLASLVMIRQHVGSAHDLVLENRQRSTPLEAQRYSPPPESTRCGESLIDEC